MLWMLGGGTATVIGGFNISRMWDIGYCRRVMTILSRLKRLIHDSRTDTRWVPCRQQKYFGAKPTWRIYADCGQRHCLIYMPTFACIVMHWKNRDRAMKRCKRWIRISEGNKGNKDTRGAVDVTSLVAHLSYRLVFAWQFTNIRLRKTRATSIMGKNRLQTIGGV